MHSIPPFKKAAKHLFRNLHVPLALRRNPLVRHLFEGLTDRPSRAGERAILERIHQLVRKGAQHCRDADLTAGKDERAFRQYAIVTTHCLEQRPIQDVAAALGISYQYCYRQRADICERIARYICEYADTSTLKYLPAFDEFRFLMECVIRRADFDDANVAFRECDRLITVAPTAQEKIEALRTAALVSLRFGNVKRARASYISAQSIYTEHLATDQSPTRGLARANIDLIAAQLARRRADMAQAFQMAKRATTQLESVQASTEHARLLHLESLYELGLALINLGDLDAAYECIARAEANLCYLGPGASRLRIRITMEAWRLRAHLLMSSKSWRPSWQRLAGLTTAFDQARASGALFEARASLLALVDYHAAAGNDAEALRLARLALLLAKEQCKLVTVQTSIQVAALLVWHRHWEICESFLPNATQLVSCDAFHRELLNHVRAVRALRLHAARDAWNLANKESDRKECVGLMVSRRIIAAAAAHEIGRTRDARSLVEAVIPAAEKLGSATTLLDAYRVAAKVTGDPEFKRQAQEVARLLTA